MEGARPALADDLPILASLAEEAVAEQVEHRGGAIWSQRETRALPALSTLADALEDPDQLVVAGTIDDVVVGYGVVRLDRLRTGRTLGVVTASANERCTTMARAVKPKVSKKFLVSRFPGRARASTP